MGLELQIFEIYMNYITQIFEPQGSVIANEFQVGGATFQMIEVPGGKFTTNGNDTSKWLGPGHELFVSAFHLAKYPVSQQLWRAVVLEAKRRNIDAAKQLGAMPSYFSGSRRPVEYVDWEEATIFCRLLNQLLDVEEGFFRLPGEVEWEYAAKAGKVEVPDEHNLTATVAWRVENNGVETVSVGSLSPNKFGLYDMSGNVQEWCEDDWFGNDYESEPPIQPYRNKPMRDGARVVRGGAWFKDSWDCRLSYRSFEFYDKRTAFTGFRLAASISA